MLCNDQVRDKLQWPVLLHHLAQHAQTDDGRDLCLTLQPNLPRESVEERWRLVEPLRGICDQGYLPPIGELPPFKKIIRALGVGALLEGPELRSIWELLQAAGRVQNFASDFEGRCSTLRQFKARLYPLPKLGQAINRAIGPDGELLDDASPELARIRKQKLGMRKKIEERIRKLLRTAEVEQYIQDDFFTIRADRYVVPIRLDGRGRVKGKIYDTSDSGQTLFLEPTEIAPDNEQLLELELAEKLEILRIFRDLSGQAAGEVDIIKTNYEELVELDFLSAQGKLASQLKARSIKLMEQPGIDLREARHPLLCLATDKPTVANHIALEEGQQVLIISGPNAGGKTVVLKTVGLIHLMAAAGLLVPCGEESSLHMFHQLFLEMGDAQNLAANLSTFSGHILGLKPVVEEASREDLVLLDELAVGTEPQTGSAIAQAILETIADRKATAMVTTHFDALKGLALSRGDFRNGSMEYSLKDFKPTYQLIMDVPGQSYGIEVAQEMGLPERVIARAKELRGAHVSALDAAVSGLMEERDRLRSLQNEVGKERLSAQSAKARWDDEQLIMKQTRQRLAKEMRESYEQEIRNMRNEFEEALHELRKTRKQMGQGGADTSIEAKQNVEKSLSQLEQKARTLAGLEAGEIPGRAVQRNELKVNQSVYVIPLKNEGVVVRIPEGDTEPMEVQVGVVKLRVSDQDLRLLDSPDPEKPKPRPRREVRTGKSVEDPNIGLTLQNPSNAIDLRGRDADDACRVAFDFIDKALLRGESAVVLIHGHGTDRLKSAIRSALKNDCPYDIRFRKGLDQEGGDGVTIVALTS